MIALDHILRTYTKVLILRDMLSMEAIWKSKVLTIKKDQIGSCEKVKVNGEKLQEVDKFNYLEVMITTDGSMGEKVAHRVLEGRKFGGRWQSCGRRI